MGAVDGVAAIFALVAGLPLICPTDSQSCGFSARVA